MTEQPIYNDGDIVNGYRYDAARNEWLEVPAQPVYQDGDVVNGYQYSAAINQWVPVAAVPPAPPTPQLTPVPPAAPLPPAPVTTPIAAPVDPPPPNPYAIPAPGAAPTGALVPTSVNPSSTAVVPAGRANVIKRRNVLVVWLLLPLITLGIYHWYWYWKINSELRDSNPRIDVKPFLALVALVPGAFLIVPPFITMYNTGKRIATAQADAGIGSSCSPVIGVLLMFVFGLNSLYYQSELNKIAAV